MIPEGSESESGTPIGVGPRLSRILDVNFVAWVYQMVLADALMFEWACS